MILLAGMKHARLMSLCIKLKKKKHIINCSKNLQLWQLIRDVGNHNAPLQNDQPRKPWLLNIYFEIYNGASTKQ